MASVCSEIEVIQKLVRISQFPFKLSVRQEQISMYFQPALFYKFIEIFYANMIASSPCTFDS